MDIRLDQEETWALRPALDMVAVALVAIVCAEVVGALIAALDLSVPRNAAGITAGPLPNPFGAIPLGERFRQATAWASAFLGVVLIASLGLITLPRVIWDTAEESPAGRRTARIVVTASMTLALVLAVAGVLGAVNLFWSPGEPGIGFQSLETPILVEHLIAAGLGGFAFWLSLFVRTRAL